MSTNKNNTKKVSHSNTKTTNTNQIPFFNADSRSITYLQSVVLCKSCFNNEIVFKQLIANLILNIHQPYNAPLILNLSIPFSMYRSIIMEKFRKLDHVLDVVTKPLSINQPAITARFKNCHYKDVVAHYTRYHYNLMDSNNSIDGSYVRRDTLGTNQNLSQFLFALKEHLASDHSQFLTISAPHLTTTDMDLLCSRFFCICEALVTFSFGAELVVDETRYYRDILQYLQKFVLFCINMHSKQHIEFNGLSNDHLKLLVSGTVLLEIGFKKKRAIHRYTLNFTKANVDQVRTKGIRLDLKKMDKSHFKLHRQIVDYTNGSEDMHFRKEVEKNIAPIYTALKKFLLSKQ